MVLWSGVLAGAPIKARAGGMGGPVHLPVGVTSPHLGCRNAPASATEDCLPTLSEMEVLYSSRSSSLPRLMRNGRWSPSDPIGLLPPKVTR